MFHQGRLLKNLLIELLCRFTRRITFASVSAGTNKYSGMIVFGQEKDGEGGFTAPRSFGRRYWRFARSYFTCKG
eukprot:764277-Hanusia_phi.AAC.3